MVLHDHVLYSKIARSDTHGELYNSYFNFWKLKVTSNNYFYNFWSVIPKESNYFDPFGIKCFNELLLSLTTNY